MYRSFTIRFILKLASNHSNSSTNIVSGCQVSNINFGISRREVTFSDTWLDPKKSFGPRLLIEYDIVKENLMHLYNELLDKKFWKFYRCFVSILFIAFIQSIFKFAVLCLHKSIRGSVIFLLQIIDLYIDIMNNIQFYSILMDVIRILKRNHHASIDNETPNDSGHNIDNNNDDSGNTTGDDSIDNNGVNNDSNPNSDDGANVDNNNQYISTMTVRLVRVAETYRIANAGYISRLIDNLLIDNNIEPTRDNQEIPSENSQTAIVQSIGSTCLLHNSESVELTTLSIYDTTFTANTSNNQEAPQLGIIQTSQPITVQSADSISINPLRDSEPVDFEALSSNDTSPTVNIGDNQDTSQPETLKTSQLETTQSADKVSTDLQHSVDSDSAEQVVSSTSVQEDLLADDPNSLTADTGRSTKTRHKTVNQKRIGRQLETIISNGQDSPNVSSTTGSPIIRIKVSSATKTTQVNTSNTDGDSFSRRKRRDPQEETVASSSTVSSSQRTTTARVIRKPRSRIASKVQQLAASITLPSNAANTPNTQQVTTTTTVSSDISSASRVQYVSSSSTFSLDPKDSSREVIPPGYPDFNFVFQPTNLSNFDQSVTVQSASSETLNVSTQVPTTVSTAQDVQGFAIITASSSNPIYYFSRKETPPGYPNYNFVFQNTGLTNFNRQHPMQDASSRIPTSFDAQISDAITAAQIAPQVDTTTITSLAFVGLPRQDVPSILPPSDHIFTAPALVIPSEISSIPSVCNQDTTNTAQGADAIINNDNAMSVSAQGSTNQNDGEITHEEISEMIDKNFKEEFYDAVRQNPVDIFQNTFPFDFPQTNATQQSFYQQGGPSEAAVDLITNEDIIMESNNLGYTMASDMGYVMPNSMVYPLENTMTYPTINSMVNLNGDVTINERQMKTVRYVKKHVNKCSQRYQYYQKGKELSRKQIKSKHKNKRFMYLIQKLKIRGVFEKFLREIRLEEKSTSNFSPITYPVAASDVFNYEAFNTQMSDDEPAIPSVNNSTTNLTYINHDPPVQSGNRVILTDTHHRTAHEVFQYSYMSHFNEATTLNNAMFQEGAMYDFSQDPPLPDSSDSTNFYAGNTYYEDEQIYYEEVIPVQVSRHSGVSSHSDESTFFSRSNSSTNDSIAHNLGYNQESVNSETIQNNTLSNHPIVSISAAIYTNSSDATMINTTESGQSFSPISNTYQQNSALIPQIPTSSSDVPNIEDDVLISVSEAPLIDDTTPETTVLIPSTIYIPSATMTSTGQIRTGALEPEYLDDLIRIASLVSVNDETISTPLFFPSSTRQLSLDNITQISDQQANTIQEDDFPSNSGYRNDTAFMYSAHSLSNNTPETTSASLSTESRPSTNDSIQLQRFLTVGAETDNSQTLTTEIDGSDLTGTGSVNFNPSLEYNAPRSIFDLRSHLPAESVFICQTTILDEVPIAADSVPNPFSSSQDGQLQETTTGINTENNDSDTLSKQLDALSFTDSPSK